MRADAPADRWLERFCSAADDPWLTTAVVAAHPDDESIGAAGRICRLANACRIVHVTDGAPSNPRFHPEPAAGLTREAYARVRRQEAIRAMAIAGIDESSVMSLGVRDQEASFQLASLARRLAELFVSTGFRIVVTHAYEGGHPDHDAVAFAVCSAMAVLRDRRKDTPVVIEMTGYHDRFGQLVRGEFLPAPFEPIAERTTWLDEQERERKRAMLAAYTTQREILAPFAVDCERFRLAPEYDFCAPPHEGALHYERSGFPIAGATWRALAKAALRSLSIRGGRQ